MGHSSEELNKKMRNIANLSANENASSGLFSSIYDRFVREQVFMNE